MKKLFTVIALIVALACGVGTFDASAKPKGKKGHNTHVVKKNAEGYANPVGHTYKFSDAGVTATLEFISADKVVASLSKGEKNASTEIIWSQKEDEIFLPDLDPLKISKDGKTLTENTGKKFELVK